MDHHAESALNKILFDTMLSRIKEGNLEGIMPEDLLIKEESGRTVAHIATVLGDLKNIPKELLTEKVLTTQDSSGSTVLHYCTDVDVSYFKEIPSNHLNDKTLSIQDNYGNTPLHNAVLVCNLSDIPEKCVSEDTLMIKNNDGHTVIEAAEMNNIDMLKSLSDISNQEKEDYDLFEHRERMPEDLKAVCEKWDQEDFNYPNCEEFLKDVQSIGYTFDYDLSAEPHDLRPIVSSDRDASNKITRMKAESQTKVQTIPNKNVQHIIKLQKGLYPNNSISQNQNLSQRR